MRFSVVIDDRELVSAVPREMERLDAFEATVRRMPLGDYLIDDRLLFERKTLLDFAESIKDGRLFGQALRLAECSVRGVLLLEGTLRDLEASRMRREALQGALITLSIFIGLPVLRSPGPSESARVMLYAAQQASAVASGALHRRGRRPKGKRALQNHVLQGFPCIGPRRAARLLNRFGTIEAVVAASLESLAEVDGIGPATARTMRWAVEETSRDAWVTARRGSSDKIGGWRT